MDSSEDMDWSDSEDRTVIYEDSDGDSDSDIEVHDADSQTTTGVDHHHNFLCGNAKRTTPIDTTRRDRPAQNNLDTDFLPATSTVLVPGTRKRRLLQSPGEDETSPPVKRRRTSALEVATHPQLEKPLLPSTVFGNDAVRYRPRAAKCASGVMKSRTKPSFGCPGFRRK